MSSNFVRIVLSLFAMASSIYAITSVELVGTGCCRTENGGSGAFTAINADQEECIAACIADVPNCVAVEVGPDDTCELHTVIVTRVFTKGSGTCSAGNGWKCFSVSEITTDEPTTQPSVLLTTKQPTIAPTTRPTLTPSKTPSSSAPTGHPSLIPTKYPSSAPTIQPSYIPSASPSSSMPTEVPTMVPSFSSPTESPTALPHTHSPSWLPTSEPTASPSYNTSCVFDDQFNYAGMDIPSASHIPAESAEVCAYLCVALPNECRAFTYIGGHCYLKTSISARQKQPVAVSGFCWSQAILPTLFKTCDTKANTNFDGFDIPSATHIALGSSVECSRMCTLFSDCFAYSYGWGRCYLKSRSDNFQHRQNVVSGECMVNPCRDQPCLNGGTCVFDLEFEEYSASSGDGSSVSGDSGGYMCECPDGFYGNTCQYTAPTSQPTESMPSGSPTPSPSSHTASPTFSPTFTSPSTFPSESPTHIPSINPSKIPSSNPTRIPSNTPSQVPTDIPSLSPSNFPTPVPTISPSISEPTSSPSMAPSKPRHCVALSNTLIIGGDMPSENPIQTLDPDECASLCFQRSICTHYTLFAGRCYLKSSNPQSVEDFGSQSGFCGAGATPSPSQVVPTRSPASWIQTYNLVGYGCCRTASESHGDILQKLDLEVTPSAAACKSFCTADDECLGYEFSSIQGCEVHKTALTHVANKGSACQPEVISCWRKLPHGSTSEPVEGVRPHNAHDDDIFTGNPIWYTEPLMPTPVAEVAMGIIGNTLFLIGEGTGKTLAMNLNTMQWLHEDTFAPRLFYGHHHSIVTLNEELYVIGGFSSASGQLQIFNPVENMWRLGPRLPWATSGSVPAVVIAGKLYACSGLALLVPGFQDDNYKQGASFDPNEGTWVSIADSLLGVNHAASGTDGSKMYIFGGRTSTQNLPGDGIPTVQVYDPDTDSWEFGPDMPVARGGVATAPYVGGHFYLCGGEEKQSLRNDVLRYNPQTDMYSHVEPMPEALHGTFPLKHPWRNSLIVAGGGNTVGQSSVASVYTLEWGVDPKYEPQILAIIDEQPKINSTETSTSQDLSTFWSISIPIGMIVVTVVSSIVIVKLYRKKRDQHRETAEQLEYDFQHSTI